jgi:hypothetical protein
VRLGAGVIVIGENAGEADKGEQHDANIEEIDLAHGCTPIVDRDVIYRSQAGGALIKVKTACSAPSCRSPVMAGLGRP